MRYRARIMVPRLLPGSTRTVMRLNEAPPVAQRRGLETSKLSHAAYYNRRMCGVPGTIIGRSSTEPLLRVTADKKAVDLLISEMLRASARSLNKGRARATATAYLITFARAPQCAVLQANGSTSF